VLRHRKSVTDVARQFRYRCLRVRPSITSSIQYDAIQRNRVRTGFSAGSCGLRSLSCIRNEIFSVIVQSENRGDITVELYKAIANRRTIRDFSERPISRATLKKIIGAGLKAPSNNHLRQWEFVVVDGLESRSKVIAAINPNLTLEASERMINRWGLKDKYQREMYLDAIPKQHGMLLTAAGLIIPCFLQEGPFLKPKTLSGLNGFASIWCCIENMLLAASAEGVYGVTRIPFDKEIVHLREVLEIPGKYSIPCYLSLGYPKKTTTKIRQLKIAVNDRLHYNRW
jgi:nitroreductase